MSEKKESARKVSEREGLKQAKAVLEIAAQKAMFRDYEFEILELKNKNIELENELKNYRLAEVITKVNNDVKIKILEFRAKNYSPDTIQDKLKYLNIVIDIEDVEDIINNIESLNSDLQIIYSEACDLYEESIKINPSILKQSNLIENQFCIDEVKKMVRLETDNEEKAKYLDRLDKYINTRTKLLGEVVLKDELEKENPLAQAMAKYKDNMEESIRIKLDDENSFSLPSMN